MMCRVRTSCVAAAIVIAAAAMPAAAEGPLAASPVGDATLSEIRGTFRPDPTSLSLRQVRTMEDAKARDDFRFFASIGATTMDVWWGGVGADLIAAGRGR